MNYRLGYKEKENGDIHVHMSLMGSKKAKEFDVFALVNLSTNQALFLTLLGKTDHTRFALEIIRILKEENGTNYPN